MPSLLLLSSACYAGTFLTHALDNLQDFIGQHRLEGQTIALVPFASVLRDYATYTQGVQEALKSLPVQIISVHTDLSLVDTCGGFLMGGGNSFKLLHDLYKYNLLDKIAQRVRQGVPYLGWSAGANVATPSIHTTNDMPIIYPPSLKALDLFPHHINPHFVGGKHHQGESRQERLAEFLALNPSSVVDALPDGACLWVQEGHARYLHPNNTLMLQITHPYNATPLSPGASFEL
ncbi:dipeptidase PepE [Helicobacter mehlei]|uniref:Dipeptidase PepE n=1 Tax=Helicobacter mehlei TaxID=2316080 RepID=A0A553V0P4_9HELI|nr:dipeptidase PepE [Helicobacter mehlei]TSA86034.1 dipeptidase PepE [Helicobacter mehlei]